MQLSVKRAIAFSVDIIVLLAIFYGNIQFVLYAFNENISEMQAFGLGQLVIINMLQLVYLLIYFIYIPVRQDGQTVGKKLLNLKEVKADGQSLMVSDYFKRDVLMKFLLISVTGGFVLVVNLILALYQLSRGQQVKFIHDMITKTTVVAL